MIYIGVKWIIKKTKKTNVGQGLGSSYQFQDGGRSGCKVEFEFKIEAGFKQT